MLPETVNVNFVDDVNYADIESGNRSETTTAVGRAVPAADKIRVIRNRGTYDLKGRRVNEGRKARVRITSDRG